MSDNEKPEGHSEDRVVVVSDAKAMATIVEVICLLVVSLSRDEKEWRDWGQPFIDLLRHSQRKFLGGESDNVKDYDSNKELVSYCVAKGLGLVIRDSPVVENGESSEDSDYVFVDEVSSQLRAFMESTSTASSSLLDDETINRLLPVYLENFVTYAAEQNQYDSRTRSLCRQFCDLFQQSYEALCPNPALQSPVVDPSDPIIQQTLTTTTTTTVAPFSNDVLTSSNRKSVLASYRLWRVGAAAAAGGAFLTVAAQIAVPTLMASLMSILGGSASLSQFLVSMIAFLNAQVEGMAFLGSIGAVGAAVAGVKMLKRTSPIEEFAIEPLHYPTANTRASGLFSGEFIVISQGKSEVVDGSQKMSDTDAVLNATVILREHCLVSASSCGDSPRSADNNQTDVDSGSSSRVNLEPIYLLVPGQVDVDVDERSVWGADGILSAVMKDSLVVSSKKDCCLTEAQGVGEGDSCQSKPAQEDDQHQAVADDKSSLNQSTTSVFSLSDEENTDWHELVMTERGWWQTHFPVGDPYLLVWARKEVAQFTMGLRNFATEQIQSFFTDQLLNLSPMQALYLPKYVLSKAADIDNPWDVVTDRARQAGQLLAHTLLLQSLKDEQQQQLQSQSQSQSPSSSSSSNSSRSNNKRPITLIGYGMGAKVVFECLAEIARISELPLHSTATSATNDANTVALLSGLGRGIIENVVLLGAPVGSGMGFASGVETFFRGHLPTWKTIRSASIVSGRFVNCYSTKDWMLYALYRQKSYDVSVAGLGPVYLQESSSKSNKSLSTEGTSSNSSSCNFSLKDIETGVVTRAMLNQVIMDGNVENVDVTYLVNNLLDYPSKLSHILQILKLEQ
jgi:hypothetical protein